MSYENYYKDDLETTGSYFIENDDTKMDLTDEDCNTQTLTGAGTYEEYQKIITDKG